MSDKERRAREQRHLLEAGTAAAKRGNEFFAREYFKGLDELPGSCESGQRKAAIELLCKQARLSGGRVS